MPRHTIRGANSHERHRIATYDDSGTSQFRQAQARELILLNTPEQRQVAALEQLPYPSREKKYGFFDLNDANIGSGSFRKDNSEWRKRFNYAPLTRYPIEITDYTDAITANTLATTTATGLTETKYVKALGSSRQYSGKDDPTTAQWHTIGSETGGDFFRYGVPSSTTAGTVGTASSLFPAARFMLNPATGVMKELADPWTINSDVTQSQYVFQIGRHTGTGAGAGSPANNGWTLDNKYEVTWGSNPVTLGDWYERQPAAPQSGSATWDRMDSAGNYLTGNAANWRRYVAGYGSEYSNKMLTATGAGSFSYADKVSNPKWSTMTSRLYAPSPGKSTVDTGIISSYTSNILLAGTGVMISEGAATGLTYTDGVLKIGCQSGTVARWSGDPNKDDTDTGKHGGIFLPYNDMTVGSGGNTSTIGVKYIGNENFNGMSKGFVAQYTGGATGPGGGSFAPLGTLADTKKEYYTEFINSWENAFGITDGGVLGEQHVIAADGTKSAAAAAGVDEELNRKAPMNNNKKQAGAFGAANQGRDLLTHAWVEYNTASDGMIIRTIIPELNRHDGDVNTLVTTADALVPSITQNFAGAANGTYICNTTTSGAGENAEVSVVVTGGVASSITITDAGAGYIPGDILTVNKALITNASVNLVFKIEKDDVENTAIMTNTNFAQSLGVATGPSDAQRNDEFIAKHTLAGEDFTLFTHSAADMYHPTALVVAQFVRDTAEVFEDMHITELYPNANSLSAKSTWMRNYDIIFNIELPDGNDSIGPTLEPNGDGFNQGQTFRFSQSAVHYKIREVGQRTINTNGKHEWEIQAMPAWDTWEEEAQPWVSWNITCDGSDNLNRTVDKGDEIFQNRRFDISIGALTGNGNNGFLGKFATPSALDPDDILFLPHEELPAGMDKYTIGDIVTVSDFTHGIVGTAAPAGIFVAGGLNLQAMAGTISGGTAATVNTTTANLVGVTSNGSASSAAGTNAKFTVATDAAGAFTVTVTETGNGYLIGNDITIAGIPGTTLAAPLVIRLAKADIRDLIANHEYIDADKLLNHPSKLSITGAVATSANTKFEVRGFLGDYYQTETIAGAGVGAPVNGAKYFTKITSIKSDNTNATALHVAADAQISIGWQADVANTTHSGSINGTYRVLERVSDTLIKVKRSNVDGSARGVNGGDGGAWDADTIGVIGIKQIVGGKITKRQTGFVDKDTNYTTTSTEFKVDIDASNIFNAEDTIYLKSAIGAGAALAAAAEIVGDNATAGNCDIGTVRKVFEYAVKGPGWLPDGADDVKKLSFFQKRVGDGATVASTSKEFSYVGSSAKFVYPITQYLTQPFLATSTALRGLLFSDKDYVTIEDVSFNLYSCGSWSVACDVPYSHFDLREHVFDHMEADLGIPSYYWDAYSSLQLERQLITLHNFSRFDMHRKISLCWWDVLRIFDADNDLVQGKDNLPAIVNDENAVRSLNGHLRENDVLAISCVVRNPHPEVKDIDMRLIFQVVNSLEFSYKNTNSFTVTQSGD